MIINFDKNYEVKKMTDGELTNEVMNLFDKYSDVVDIDGCDCNNPMEVLDTFTRLTKVMTKEDCRRLMDIMVEASHRKSIVNLVANG